MTESDVAVLRQNIDKVVRLYCTDGEVISAKIDLVAEDDGEIVYQMLATNQESKPAYVKAGKGAVYLLRFDDVERVENESADPIQS
jgi:hypothetical protein